MRLQLALCALLLGGGCEHKASGSAEPAPTVSAQKSPALQPVTAGPEPMPVCSADCSAAQAAAQAPLSAAQAQPGERRLGAEMKLAGEPVPVAQLLHAPEPYLGTTVKCEGKVARVCQAAGCWLELQAEAGGEGLRVPMAGHAFFIPQDAVGHVAVVEGQLRRHELPSAQRKHYEGEGMQAVGPLALEATSVLLR